MSAMREIPPSGIESYVSLSKIICCGIGDFISVLGAWLMNIPLAPLP